MAPRIGVDIGGTFTDLVFVDEETKTVRAAKGATTPAAPDEGVIALVDDVVSTSEIGDADLFLHGSTVGLNALLERKGATVGLLTTRGFRDVLELRRGEREVMFSLAWRPPDPLVPRWLRLPVTERMYADGLVHTPLVQDDVRDAAAVFAAEGVDCVAVVFLHAYANPEHELAAEDLLRKFGFEGQISLSHRISGEFREYERTSTTTIDAYVRPVVATYLGRLESGLRDRGFRGELLVTSSGGGAMAFDEAEARPFETIMSGPVAGAVGAGAVCQELGIGRAITADVGGTSFDTCLIIHGHPHVKYEGEVGGMPLQCRWVDVRSIGAGGGSIAYVDGGGLLRAGPQSAGATPGPASYGRGGSVPTATDAAVILGMLGAAELAGGLKLDVTAAARAFSPLASALGLSLDDVARGVLTILTASMANAIRSVTIEQGEDPRDAHLIAFGGAGPLFATLLARELEIGQILIPNHAGNFSAWGLLCQDVVRSTALTSVAPLDDEGLEQAQETARSLSEQLSVRRRSSIVGDERVEAALDLRYLGQEYTLTVPIPMNGSVRVSSATVRSSFTSTYERTFGHTMEEPVEIVAVRVSARTQLERPRSEASTNRQERLPRTVEAYSFTAGRRQLFRVLDRAEIRPGDQIAGPAIITEQTTTSFVDVGFDVSRHASGILMVTDRRRR